MIRPTRRDHVVAMSYSCFYGEAVLALDEGIFDSAVVDQGTDQDADVSLSHQLS